MSDMRLYNWPRRDDVRLSKVQDTFKLIYMTFKAVLNRQVFDFCTVRTLFYLVITKTPELVVAASTPSTRHSID